MIKAHKKEKSIKFNTANEQNQSQTINPNTLNLSNIEEEEGKDKEKDINKSPIISNGFCNKKYNSPFLRSQTDNCIANNELKLL